jgi:hypothetical protein
MRPVHLHSKQAMQERRPPSDGEECSAAMPPRWLVAARHVAFIAQMHLSVLFQMLVKRTE